METIKSFQVDHLKLSKGVYVSREQNGTITYDVRLRAPYKDLPMEASAAHSLEHCLATIARNSPLADKVIYVGPMGCLTGFYIITTSDVKLPELTANLIGWCSTLLNLTDVPGATEKQCGNYKFQNLTLAKQYVREFLNDLMSKIPNQYQYL